MRTIIWLVKQFFIKLGWAKTTNRGDSCGLTVTFPQKNSEMYCQGSRPRRSCRFFSTLAGFFSTLLEDDSPVDSHSPRRPT